jgi:BirA family biotin operon repressor/biotin-[acetyl-CoA-carboxylase] ligase
MPYNMVAAMLREGLDCRIVGHPIFYHPELDSTMDEAARLAEDGTAEGATVVAEVQTAGRGRFGRTWVSPAGNLWVSILLRPSLDSLRYLSILSGVASARAITSTTGLPVTLKWPNDLRIGGRKVGGVLVENSLSGSTVRHAIIGIGINVSLDPSSNTAIAATATALEIEHQAPVSRETLLRNLLQETELLYQGLAAGNTPLEEWRGLLDTLGKQVTVQELTASGGPGNSYSGIAEDVDSAGNLILRLTTGNQVTLAGGEVTMQQNPTIVSTQPI